MTTMERAEALAEAAGHFPLLGQLTATELTDAVGLELGHPEILDGFRPYGCHWAQAMARAPFLHILSGATPHAALQSLIRGLLVGGSNLMKLPSQGLPEVGQFVSLLPAELQAGVELRQDWSEEWARQAGLALIFGSDESLAAIRKKLPPRLPVLEFGHKLSFALIENDPGLSSAEAAAEAVSAFDQKGCLSPHVIYVREEGTLQARAYAERLAEAMAAYDTRIPRGKISPAEAAEIMDLRANYRFRSQSDHRAQLWCSENNDHWTVVYEEDSWFAPSCLNRVVYVKPWPQDPAMALAPIRQWLGSASIFPARPGLASQLRDLGVGRIAPLDRTQLPPFTWHQEGRSNLAAMIRWVDFEGAPA